MFYVFQHRGVIIGIAIDGADVCQYDCLVTRITNSLIDRIGALVIVQRRRKFALTFVSITGG